MRPRRLLADLLWLIGLAALLPGVLDVLAYTVLRHVSFDCWTAVWRVPDVVDLVVLPAVGFACWVGALILFITIKDGRRLRAGVLIPVIAATILVGVVSLGRLVVVILLRFVVFVVTGGGIG